MQPLALFGPVDAILQPIVEYVILVLVLANLATRYLAHRANVRAAREEGVDAVSRNTVHEITTVLLVLGSFYFMTVERHAGLVLSALVLGLFITDFFEFEARKVEAAEDRPLDSPRAAIGASVLVLLYAGYQALFFAVEPIWNSIV